MIEYGAGCLRNALHLQRRSFVVTVVEYQATRERFVQEYAKFARARGRFLEWPKEMDREPPKTVKYDLAVITFVIETICRPNQRIKLLQHCRRRLRATGALILSVRGIADVVTARSKGIPCSDG